MSDFQSGVVAVRRHGTQVAGRACRGLGVIFSHDPFPAGQVHFHMIGILDIGDAVFRLTEDFILGMIGPHVAFAAVFGAARHLGGKFMAGMAGGARSPGPIHIHATHARIRPGVGRVNGCFLFIFERSQADHAAMALLAAVIRRRRAFGKPSQKIIHGSDKL